MPFDPTKPSVDANGYRYVETSSDWKTACLDLPCFSAVWWPDYATKVIEDVIDGQDVVIQLWKGYCEQFLNLAEMPGGVGAEVGIYRRIPGKPLPKGSSPPSASPLAAFARKIEGFFAEDFWWPYPELNAQIKFHLVNPESGKTFFTAGPEKTYWLNKWMAVDSYDRYRAAEKTPSFACNYQLNFSINGKTYPAWLGKE
jgi:hypothetical protein